MHFDLLYMKNLIYLYLWWFQTGSQYGKCSFYNLLFNFKDWSISSRQHFIKKSIKTCLFELDLYWRFHNNVLLLICVLNRKINGIYDDLRVLNYSFDEGMFFYGEGEPTFSIFRKTFTFLKLQQFQGCIFDIRESYWKIKDKDKILQCIEHRNFNCPSVPMN